MGEEKKIETRIRNAAEGRGWLVWKLHGGPMQQSGLPDLLMFKDGRTLAIEVKAPGGQATPLQEHRIDQLHKHGIVAEVVDNVDRALELMRGEP